MDEINITEAQYTKDELNPDAENNGIKATIDGVEMSVPLDPSNRHYAAIMKAVEAGELTIASAES